ncbi:MAG: hypothetical protein WBF42_14690 [Terracidiphilus sp.]
MDPHSLRATDFSAYPPMARQFAIYHLDLLQNLPISLAAALLREVSDFDTRFPQERAVIEARFACLARLSPADREHLTAGFAKITLPPELVAEDWAASPQKFEEDLSAWLWASHQIDAFHTAGFQFADELGKSMPDRTPPVSRWVVVILDADLRAEAQPLFRKLRPHGVYYSHVVDPDGTATILQALNARVGTSPMPYRHWYIDGGARSLSVENPVMHFSWAGSAALRQEVLAKVRAVMESGRSGPEALRSIMAVWTPGKLASAGSDPLVSRFVMSVYGEGSGTQIFSTSFVQWAARELMRRAEPLSLVARFGPRERQRSMNEMFATTNAEPDRAGSLVDGDFGAYYTWINLNRLPGADEATFIVWSEAHGQAVAIGPGRPRNTQSPDALSVAQLLKG